jgi:predicted DNA-binding transcriptional regulator AlpA
MGSEGIDLGRSIPQEAQVSWPRDRLVPIRGCRLVVTRPRNGRRRCASSLREDMGQAGLSSPRMCDTVLTRSPVHRAPPRDGLQEPRECGMRIPASGGRRERDGRQAVEEHAGVIPAFFRIRDVLRITALSRPTIYRRIAAGRFPPPVHLGGRMCAWSQVALQTWINDPDNYRCPQTCDSMARRSRGRPRKYAVT